MEYILNNDASPPNPDTIGNKYETMPAPLELLENPAVYDDRAWLLANSFMESEVKKFPERSWTSFEILDLVRGMHNIALHNRTLLEKLKSAD